MKAMEFHHYWNLLLQYPNKETISKLVKASEVVAKGLMLLPSRRTHSYQVDLSREFGVYPWPLQLRVDLCLGINVSTTNRPTQYPFR